MPAHDSRWDIVELRQRTNSAGHVTILTMLFRQTRVIEIVPPFIERLGLFAHDTRALRVAIGAGGRSSHRGIRNALMRRGRTVRAADLAVRRHMTTGAGNANRFAAECTWNGLRHDRRIDVG